MVNIHLIVFSVRGIMTCSLGQLALSNRDTTIVLHCVHCYQSQPCVQKKSNIASHTSSVNNFDNFIQDDKRRLRAVVNFFEKNKKLTGLEEAHL